MGLGSLALGSLMNRAGAANPLAMRIPQVAGKVKNVIYLHMAGSPPQLDLFDYKPMLNKLDKRKMVFSKEIDGYIQEPMTLDNISKFVNRFKKPYKNNFFEKDFPCWRPSAYFSGTKILRT